MAGVIAIGAIPFLPVFASLVGCLAVGYGALVGTLTAMACSRLRLSVLPSMAALALVHVLVAPWLLTDVGSGLAAVKTVLASTVTVWRDALTVPMPLSSFSGMTGARPFMRMRASSEVTPTTRRSQRSRAARRMLRCPWWNMSKPPGT